MARFSPILLAGLIFAATSLNGESKNAADYPLRVHIFGEQQTTFYSHREIDESRGDGRANLFADGEVHGVDFNYDCAQKLRTSFGYETYPAKWKKPGRQLVVLFPVFGKANAFFTCNLNTAVKDYAYVMHNGRMDSEPPAEFKTWMDKHNYDPEHGKDTPTGTRSDPASAGPPPAQ